jgi:hypothetical protein
MRRKAFLDDRGVLRRVTQLPPLPLLEFLDWLEVAEGQLRQVGKPLETLYTGDSMFRQLCDRCLELHGLEPDSCSPALVVRLVFEQLPQLNQPERGDAETREHGEKVAVREWVYGLIAALMELEGVRGAIAACETVPADLLDGILKARMKQVAADKDKPLNSPEYQELLQELDESLLTVTP